MYFTFYNFLYCTLWSNSKSAGFKRKLLRSWSFINGYINACGSLWWESPSACPNSWARVSRRSFSDWNSYIKICFPLNNPLWKRRGWKRCRYNFTELSSCWSSEFKLSIFLFSSTMFWLKLSISSLSFCTSCCNSYCCCWK